MAEVGASSFLVSTSDPQRQGQILTLWFYHLLPVKDNLARPELDVV